MNEINAQSTRELCKEKKRKPLLMIMNETNAQNKPLSRTQPPNYSTFLNKTSNALEFQNAKFEIEL